MPRPPRVCSCGRTVQHGATCVCRQARERERPGAAERGYDRGWRMAAKRFLNADPRCSCGCGRLADVVDHRIAHKGDQGLFWDRANWQAMNGRCHNRKTVQRDGGFGNKLKDIK
jgi:5-methylcytosine-specific restriction enzyme A